MEEFVVLNLAERLAGLTTIVDENGILCDTIVDKEGNFGRKGQLYVVNFQKGGFFVHDHKRIKDSVQKRSGRKLTPQYSIPLDQEIEVDAFLDAVKNNDTAVLVQKGWMKEGSLYLFKGFNQFDEESARDDFLAGMPSYAVLRTADSAKGNLSGYQSLAVQRDNEDLAITFGGKKKLAEMLDVADKLEWLQFGSYHDGYQHKNSGRVVIVNDHYFGVYSNNGIIGSGRSVGVAPEALAARAKIVSPLPLEATVTRENGSNGGPYREAAENEFAACYRVILGDQEGALKSLDDKTAAGLTGLVQKYLATRGQ